MRSRRRAGPPVTGRIRIALRYHDGAHTCLRKHAQSRHVPDGHARLRERISMSFPQSEETLQSGVAGVAVSRTRERRGAQVPRVAPRSGAEEHERRCAAGRQYGPATPRSCDEALGAEHRAKSREGRRPQPTAGRVSETATPATPRRTISERHPDPASPPTAKRQRRRHKCAPRRQDSSVVVPGVGRARAPGGRVLRADNNMQDSTPMSSPGHSAVAPALSSDCCAIARLLGSRLAAGQAYRHAYAKRQPSVILRAVAGSTRADAVPLDGSCNGPFALRWRTKRRLRCRLRRICAPPVAKRGAGGRRSETACRGAGGGSCLAHSSAVGCGLRPSRDFARCSAPRASSQDRGVAGPY